MSEEDFYNILKGFTLDDIPYLAVNNFIGKSDAWPDTSSFSHYRINKSFRLDDIQLDTNDNIRINVNTNEWLYNKPHEYWHHHFPHVIIYYG